ncbi:MAG: hypothetical protein ACXV2C_00400 [Candidatus Bathyarchaeia archaeon]
MADDDFGFLLVSEQELKQHEELLKKKVAEQSSTIVRTAAELNEKINTLRAMIMPLLNNLAKDPDKEYIRWPDRAEKIHLFIQKVNEFVDS